MRWGTLVLKRPDRSLASSRIRLNHPPSRRNLEVQRRNSTQALPLQTCKHPGSAPADLYTPQALPLQTCKHFRFCPCRPVHNSGSALADLHNNHTEFRAGPQEETWKSSDGIELRYRREPITCLLTDLDCWRERGRPAHADPKGAHNVSVDRHGFLEVKGATCSS